MSDFKIVDEYLKKIRKELNDYKTVYLDVSTQIGHLYVVKEFLKDITKKWAIVYLVNNVDSGESITYIKNYFKDIKNYKISTVYKNIEPNIITIISATEENLDKKIKKLDCDCPILLINDCSLSLKPMTLNKINRLIAPTRILNLVYTPRLTEHELMTITTKEAGYIFIDADKDETQKFVKGFMVNSIEEFDEFNYDELPRRLVYCGYKKFIELNQILTTNGKLIRNQSLGIKYLIVTKNQAEANKAKEYLYNYGFDYSININSSYEYDISNNSLDNNDADVIIVYGNKFLDTEDMKKFQVITMLENTCTPNVLFELTKKLFKNGVVSDDEQYGYKYLYIYDTPDMVKKSLMPTFIKPSTALISNELRNGVKQIAVVCSGLESVKYRDIEDNNENRELFGKVVKKYCRKFSSISTNKEEQPILIDSYIKAYNNYDFITGYVVDVNPEELEYEARGLINKFISNTILSEELKISRESRNLICDYMFNLLKQSSNLDRVDLSIAIVNDMKNINFSITGKIVADFIIEYCKKHKEKIETRKMIEKTAVIPAIEIGNIKSSEYFKAKKCAYTYGKKLNPETEKQFMNYLENSSFVEWWTKNGDLGQANFSVSCVDKKGLPQGFYPDWIIKIKDKRLDKDVYLIVDTKAGMTLDDSGLTGAKIKALQEWCDNYNKNNEIQFWCGIITFVNGFWQISSNNFDYIIDMNYSNFVKFEDWLEQKIKAA